MSDIAEPHQPKHRRDGVPLDGAPDLGLYTAPSPIISEPVTTSTWAAPPEYVAPSSVPPESPAAPTVSEYPSPPAPPPVQPLADPVADFEGENPDTAAAG